MSAGPDWKLIGACFKVAHAGDAVELQLHESINLFDLVGQSAAADACRRAIIALEAAKLEARKVLAPPKVAP